MDSSLREKNGQISRDLKEGGPFFDLKHYNIENVVHCQWEREG
jgi:uncharacterized protein YodC (DUF2158 family)